MTSSESVEATDTETKGVFGSSLTSRLRHTGRAVAPCITRALQYINETAAHSDGLFRRPGVLSRVQKLQEIMNNDSGKRLLFLLTRTYFPPFITFAIFTTFNKLTLLWCQTFRALTFCNLEGA